MESKHVFNNCTVSCDTSKCFDKLTSEEAVLIEENRVEVSYKKGEIICKHGTFASHVMYICSGLVKIYVENEAGTLILKILPKGNLIGLSSIYDGNSVFQYSASTYQDSVIQMIDMSTFKQLMKQNIEFSNGIINVLCENSIQTYGRFFCFTQKQSYGRMADILLCLACSIFKSNSFELNLTRKELAELTGMSTERVIRIIKKFKEDGLITLEGKQFQITNIEKLQNISNHG